jgi:thiol-disulfide isomerase/thioredoxin
MSIDPKPPRPTPVCDQRHFVWTRRRALSALCFGAVALSPIARAKTPGEVEVGQLLREATMQGLNGPSRNLSEFRGKPLVINVWASWCAPCRQEMASLERLAWREPTGQFTVIGISTDDYPDRARAALRSSNATINHFIDSKLLLENMLGATQLPLTVLVDANGRVLDKIYGAREWDSPESLKLIAKTFLNRRIAPIP